MIRWRSLDIRARTSANTIRRSVPDCANRWRQIQPRRLCVRRGGSRPQPRGSAGWMLAPRRMMTSFSRPVRIQLARSEVTEVAGIQPVAVEQTRSWPRDSCSTRCVADGPRNWIRPCARSAARALPHRRRAPRVPGSGTPHDTRRNRMRDRRREPASRCRRASMRHGSTRIDHRPAFERREGDAEHAFGEADRP